MVCLCGAKNCKGYVFKSKKSNKKKEPSKPKQTKDFKVKTYKFAPNEYIDK